jgi:acetyl esterase/lipase
MTLHPAIAARVVTMPPMAPDILDDIAGARAQAARPAAPPDPRLDTTDRTIPGPGGGEIPIRVYRPRPATAEPTGLEIWFHGGGWVLGDLDSADGDCRELSAGHGLTVINVGYRLAPEHPYPAGLDDSYQVLRWAVGHAGELGIDPARVGVGGQSAGGALAAGVALRARDDGGPALRHLMLGYPVLDSRLQNRSVKQNPLAWLFGDSPANLWRAYLGDSYLEHGGARAPAYAVPALAADVSGLPPTYLMAGEQDTFRDDALEFADRLLSAAVPVDLNLLAGMPHMFDVFGPGIPAVQRAVSAWRSAVGEALTPPVSSHRADPDGS